MKNNMTFESGVAVKFEKFEKDGKVLRRFAMTGYSGAPMKSPYGTVIIDLEGASFRSSSTPIFQHHDRTRIVGHTTRQSIESGVELEGVISGVGDAANEVVQTSENGFPWQSSVSVDIYEYDEIMNGKSKTVNKYDVEGPAIVLAQTVIYETSFVPLGRDKDTPSVVFSEGAQENLQRVFEAAKQKQNQEAEMPEENKNTPDPQALEAAKSEGRKEAGNQLQALVAEFSDDVEFAMDAFNRNLSLEAAKAEAYDKQKAKIATLEASIDELKNNSQDNSNGEGVLPVEFKEEPSGSSNFQAQFDAKVKEQMSKGMSEAEAICRVSTEDPQLADKANGFA